jgi:hypothetical protein
MVQAASRAYMSADLQRFEPVTLDFFIQNASETLSLDSKIAGYPILFSSAAITQATVDAFLGSTNEIAATTAFGATAMGTDALGFVINMKGQASSALWMEVAAYQTTNLLYLVEGNGTSTTVLPDTLTSGFAVTSLGNIYGRIVATNLSTQSGNIKFQLAVYLK